MANRVRRINEKKTTEVRLSKKTSEYRSRWERHGWDSQEWIRRQKARGRLSGNARRNRTLERDLQIVETLKSGMSISGAARKWNLCRKAIRKISDREGVGPNQHR